MRSKWWSVAAIGAVIIALAGTVFLAFRFRREAPNVRVSILNYRVTNDTLVVAAAARNVGQTYLMWRCSPPRSVIEWESDRGWTNSNPAYFSKQSSFGVLSPGQQLHTYKFTIPRSARRIRVGCQFETLGFRGNIAARITQHGPLRQPGMLSSGLSRIVRLMPAGNIHEVEFWSEAVEMTRSGD